jgi:lysozyme family protein
MLLLSKLGLLLALNPIIEAEGMDRFTRAFSYVYGNEKGYVDDPDDSGGPTNFGVTIKTLSEWRGRPVTAEDVKRLEITEAMNILRKKYWDFLRCDEIQNEAVTIVLFDAGVLFGRSGAVKTLQKALVALGAEIKVDGVMGPKTIAAVNALGGPKLVDIFSGELKNRVRSIVLARPEKQKFVKGWTYRISRYARLAPLREAIA